MARDAITRQYDVEKNRVTLTCADGKEGYRPGLITFHAKKGKSIDLTKIRESIAATRLSGGTDMSVDYLEITALGAVEAGDKELLLTVSGSGQQFSLVEADSAKGMAQKLRDALARGEKVTGVTGRVQGWNGRFPAVLRALATAPAIQTLQVIDFEVAKK
jgi:autonomous glycyl radical cofactor GrcA